MFTSERHETLVPFPGVPEALKAGVPVNDFVLRRFGLDESDLSVDFHGAPHPMTVTVILERCTRTVTGAEIDRSFFWNLTVGKRIECLLNLISFGDSPEISFRFRCPADACGQESEAELSIAEISELQARAYTQDCVSIEIEDGRVSFRRPTGYDQLRWLKTRFSGEPAAMREMLQTLVIQTSEFAVDEGAITDQVIAVVGQAMDECDPLVNFNLNLRCPDCGKESPCEVDLQAFSLKRLRQAQLSLISSVHRLAAHYHWNEGEIFAVPYWRRAAYLKLIESDKN
jgi:hypothetical protein